MRWTVGLAGFIAGSWIKGKAAPKDSNIPTMVQLDEAQRPGVELLARIDERSKGEDRG